LGTETRGFDDAFGGVIGFDLVDWVKRKDIGKFFVFIKEALRYWTRCSLNISVFGD
jgi:hypothetical protein